MRASETFYSSRLAVAWKNVRANRRLRPVDMMNGFKMVQPLSVLNNKPAQPFAIPQVMYDIFTRLQVTYDPHPVPPAAKLPVHQMHFRSMHEPRVGLFADAPDHLSGVCKTLAEWKHQADLAAYDLTIHGCGVDSNENDTVSFTPMGSINMDTYAGLSLNIPRVEDVLDYVKRMSFDVIHVSTPGPMGLLGLLAARQYKLPVCGTYHTDFPRYVAALTGEPHFEQVCWTFMRWFYGQLDRVAAPTETIRRELIDNGLLSDRVHVVGRGVHTEDFSPAHRSRAWREKHGHRYPVKLLYVGRISREKNLETLVQSFQQLRRTRPDVCLVIVGDGPYREEMRKSLGNLPVYFTGSLKGLALAKVYASCDLFVFPSKTDTYGRVVLEAQASGLPVVVSDAGGPKDAMLDGQTGVVVPSLNAATFAQTIDELTDNPARMSDNGKAARRYASERTQKASFDDFWALHQFPKKQRRHNREKVMV